MRTVVKMTGGVVVLLALAGCSSDDPKSGISALEAPAGPADKFSGSAKMGIDADSIRLLAEENDYTFYAGLPDPANGSVCLIIHSQEGEQTTAACGGSVSLGPVGFEGLGVRAKLTADDYDASKELSEGWQQLHENLLVHGI